MAQPRFRGPARWLSDPGCVLATTVWYGVRHRRQRKNGTARRMGPVLLSFRPVHEWPRYGRGVSRNFADAHFDWRRGTTRQKFEFHQDRKSTRLNSSHV